MAIVDKVRQKFMFSTSLRQWLINNSNKVQRYLDDKVHHQDHVERWVYFLEYRPHIGKVLAEDYDWTNAEKVNILLNQFFKSSVISPLTGKRGSGKTAFACWLAEEAHKRGIPVCFVQTTIPLPDWIIQVETPQEVPNNCIVIYDEASITLCIPENMKILTPSGFIDIKELKQNDEVISWNFKKKNVEISKSIKSDPLFKSVIRIHTTKGVIESSPNHRWFTKNGLKQAKDLNTKDSIILIDDSTFSKYTKNVNGHLSKRKKVRDSKTKT